jgi:hypothetical protein
MNHKILFLKIICYILINIFALSIIYLYIYMTFKELNDKETVIKTGKFKSGSDTEII